MNTGPLPEHSLKVTGGISSKPGKLICNIWQNIQSYIYIYIYIYIYMIRFWSLSIKQSAPIIHHWHTVAEGGNGQRFGSSDTVTNSHYMHLVSSLLTKTYLWKKTVEIRQFYCNNNPVEDYGCVYGLSVSIIHFLIDTMIQNTINVIIQKKKKKKKSNLLTLMNQNENDPQTRWTSQMSWPVFYNERECGLQNDKKH